MEFLTNEFFLIFLTFLIFFLAKLLQKKTGWILLNPILLTIALLIIFLKSAGITYDTYESAGRYIEFWLKPAVVALGIPLYLQLSSIKKQLVPILLSQLLAKLFGATQEVILSLAAKSVTTPIAMEVTRTVGGIPSLTAAVVVCVGLFGALFGFQILRLLRIKTPPAQGLSMGAAAHAVGTDTAMGVSQTHGAYASLGLILNGLFTSILTPYILQWCNIL